MRTLFRTLALVALAGYLAVTTTGLRMVRESLPTATAATSQGGEWWDRALAFETNRWAMLGRIGKGVRGE